jgi:hypothetical protein
MKSREENVGEKEFKSKNKEEEESKTISEGSQVEFIKSNSWCRT